MACSVFRQVGATYQGLWTKARKNADALRKGYTKKRFRGLDQAPHYVSPTLSYVYGRDYSVGTGQEVSLLTLCGRIHVGYQGYKKHVALLQRGACLGGAKLWYERSKKRFYLLVSVTIDMPDPVPVQSYQVIGVDVGQRYLATVATTTGRAQFYCGKEIRQQADHYARLQKRLQHKGTRSAPGHLNDATAMTYLTPNMNSSGRFSGDLTPLGVTIDASGAWWDAGDYLKFVETISYTVDMLQLGVRDLPNQMGAGSTSANFTAEVKFGLDWLQHMWDDSTQTLYYEVGIGTGNSKTIGDHDIWRLPQVDDTFGGTNSLYRYIRNRPVFRAGAPGSLISPNLAGRLAGDFALCFQLFKSSNAPYANQCLLSAEHIFALANTNPSGKLLTVAPYSFYPETEWRDDLEFGATELYFALAGGNLPSGLPQTNPLFYLQAGAQWAHAYITGPGDAADTLNLYDVSGAAHYELYRAIAAAGNPSGLAVTQADLLNDLKKQLDKAVAQAGIDPFGFGFTWAAFDTTSHGAGLVVMASEYDHLTNSSTYAAYGVRWLANILGANAWGISLIVGDGGTFPHCMQHQVANLAGSLDGSPPVLAGAAVEGPNSTTSRGLVSGRNCCDH
jgi:endoglucanase